MSLRSLYLVLSLITVINESLQASMLHFSFSRSIVSLGKSFVCYLLFKWRRRETLQLHVTNAAHSLLVLVEIMHRNCGNLKKFKYNFISVCFYYDGMLINPQPGNKLQIYTVQNSRRAQITVFSLPPNRASSLRGQQILLAQDCKTSFVQ